MMRKGVVIGGVVLVAILAIGIVYAIRSHNAADSDPYAAAILACDSKNPSGAVATPIPNDSVQYVTDTTRLFINTPKNLYPENILQSWTTVTGNATALYISNGGLPGEAFEATPECWSTYVELDGAGEVDLRVKSIVNGAPDYFVRFIISPNPPISPAEQSALVQLQEDLHGVTPHFLDSSEESARALTPEEQKIKADVSAILIPASMDGVWDVSLVAVGERYVVAALMRPTDAGSPLEIIDSTTGQITPIPGLFQFNINRSAVYLSAQNICTYTLDQPSCVSVPGATLSGDEYYGDDETMGGYFQPQDETHTDTSLTIAVLKLTPDPASCPDCKVLKKERDVTLPLP